MVLDQFGQGATLSVPVSYIIVLKVQRHHRYNWISARFHIQAGIRDTADLAPDQCSGEFCNKISHNLFASGKFCFQFVSNATCMKHNKIRYAYNHHCQLNVIYNITINLQNNPMKYYHHFTCEKIEAQKGCDQVAG